MIKWGKYHFFEFMNQNKENWEVNESLSSVIVENLSILNKKFPEKSKVIAAYYHYFCTQKFENDDEKLNIIYFMWKDFLVGFG